LKIEEYKYNKYKVYQSWELSRDINHFEMHQCSYVNTAVKPIVTCEYNIYPLNIPRKEGKRI